jgi:hypothetical protein
MGVAMTDNKQPEMYNVPPEVMQMLSDEFNQLVYTRHVGGAEEYGEFKFLANDMVRFIAEELADIANYCRYTYMKLRLMEKVINAGGSDLTDFVARAYGDPEHPVSSGFAPSAESSEVSPTLPES